MDEFKDGVRIYSIDKNQEEMTIYLGDLKRFHNEYLELKEIEKEHQRINGELRVENKELKGSLQTYEILLKTNIEENQELKNKIQILTEKIKKTIKFNKQFVEIEGCSNYVIKILEEYLKILGVEDNENKNNK